MDTSTTIIAIKTIIMTINKKTLESSKGNSNESKISKLNNVWNNYNKRLKYIGNNKMNYSLTGDIDEIESKELSNINGRNNIT